MEVTRENFKDCLAEIAKDIEEACFISIDGEFTGLSNERNILPFDTAKEYYTKHWTSTKGFICVQLGLSCWKKNTEGGKISVKSFNIYTFPQSSLATFLCQGQSISFLADNGFNFQKLFSSGIGYANEKEEEKLKQDVSERQEYRQEQIKARTSGEEQDISNRNFLPIPENERVFLDNVREKIQSVLDNKKLEVKFEKTNAFQRKLIYELIERDFNNKVSTSTKNGEGNQKVMVIMSKRSLDDELKLEQCKIRDDENSLIEKVGLRLLLKEISKSKKLIVGHNCLLDFFHMLNQCFEDLPEDYDEFKKLIHRVFPNIMDTKFITNSDKFKELFPSTVLNQVLERVQATPFKEIEIEWENPYNTYSLKNPKEHEAGYDSFLTGYCFLALLDYLKVPLAPHFERSKELIPFLNRIAVQRIALPYIYITGNEPTPCRTHVFYIKFPQKWQTSDIQDHFKNYGPVQISWVDSTTAFVSLFNRENSSCVVKTIAKPHGFEVMSYADFQARQQKGEKRKKNASDSEASNDQTPTKPDAKRKKKNKGTFKECNNWTSKASVFLLLIILLSSISIYFYKCIV